MNFRRVATVKSSACQGAGMEFRPMLPQREAALTMDLANIQEMAADAASRSSPGAAPSRERPPIRGFGGILGGCFAGEGALW